MKKLLNNPWVSGALAIAAIAFVGNSVMDYSSSANAYLDYETDREDEAISSDETPEAIQAIFKFDPASIQAMASQTSTGHLFERKKEIVSTIQTAPEKQAMAQATIRVKGIWIQNNIRYVIIDDQMLQPGQSIERVRVDRIEEQGVWVTSNQAAVDLDTQFIQPGQSWTYQYPKPNDPSQN